jgi:hypothetical protein
MFIELMLLIEKRAITITVATLKDGHVRVSVVPAALAEDSKVNEKIGYSSRDKITKIPESAVHALTTPLSLTGAPDEIDARLAERLIEGAEVLDRDRFQLAIHDTPDFNVLALMLS